MEIYKTKIYKISDSVTSLNGIYNLIVDQHNNIVKMDLITRLKLYNETDLKLNRTIHMEELFKNVGTLLLDKEGYEIITNTKIPIVLVKEECICYGHRKIQLNFTNNSKGYFGFSREKINNIQQIDNYVLEENKENIKTLLKTKKNY